MISNQQIKDVRQAVAHLKRTATTIVNALASIDHPKNNLVDDNKNTITSVHPSSGETWTIVVSRFSEPDVFIVMPDNVMFSLKGSVDISNIARELYKADLLKQDETEIMTKVRDVLDSVQKLPDNVAKELIIAISATLASEAPYSFDNEKRLISTQMKQHIVDFLTGKA